MLCLEYCSDGALGLSRLTKRTVYRDLCGVLIVQTAPSILPSFAPEDYVKGFNC